MIVETVRLDHLREMMEQKSVSSCLISSPANRFYFSGFTGSAGSLFITKESAILFTDSRYTEQATKQAPHFTILDSRQMTEQMNEIRKKQKLRTVGFEDTFVSYAEYQKLHSALDSRLVSLGDAVTALRRTKSLFELEKIKTAAEIADAAFQAVLPTLSVGMTEVQVALRLETFMRKQGASGTSFDTIVASGARSALPHGAPTKKELEKGDFVVMDFGCIYQGYCSDMTRTVAIRKASQKQKEIYHIVLYAQEKALAGIKPGMKTADLDAIARNAIREFGYDQYFGHGLGHSVGIEIHEAPSASPNSKDTLEICQTMTVEPGIYLPGEFGVRIEDLVAVGDEQIANLTHSTKELCII